MKHSPKHFPAIYVGFTLAGAAICAAYPAPTHDANLSPAPPVERVIVGLQAVPSVLSLNSPKIISLVMNKLDGSACDISCVTSGYGWRQNPITHEREKHEGVDLRARLGAAIYAAASGVITQARFKGGYGRYISIQHDSQMATAYAHMSRFAKNIRDGAHVLQGQVIGYAGESGEATGPHAHFEVLHNGKQVDPLNIRQAREDAVPKMTIQVVTAKPVAVIAAPVAETGLSAAWLGLATIGAGAMVLRKSRRKAFRQQQAASAASEPPAHETVDPPQQEAARIPEPFISEIVAPVPEAPVVEIAPVQEKIVRAPEPLPPPREKPRAAEPFISETATQEISAAELTPQAMLDAIREKVKKLDRLPPPPATHGWSALTVAERDAFGEIFWGRFRETPTKDKWLIDYTDRSHLIVEKSRVTAHGDGGLEDALRYAAKAYNGTCKIEITGDTEEARVRMAEQVAAARDRLIATGDLAADFRIEGLDAFRAVSAQRARRPSARGQRVNGLAAA